MADTIEVVIVRGTRESIEFDLSGYTFDVLGFSMREEGWLVMFQGDADDVGEIIIEWQEAGRLVDV
jgi:hypothetical protein